MVKIKVIGGSEIRHFPDTKISIFDIQPSPWNRRTTKSQSKPVIAQPFIPPAPETFWNKLWELNIYTRYNSFKFFFLQKHNVRHRFAVTMQNVITNPMWDFYVSATWDTLEMEFIAKVRIHKMFLFSSYGVSDTLVEGRVSHSRYWCQNNVVTTSKRRRVVAG